MIISTLYEEYQRVLAELTDLHIEYRTVVNMLDARQIELLQLKIDGYNQRIETLMGKIAADKANIDRGMLNGTKQLKFPRDINLS